MKNLYYNEMVALKGQVEAATEELKIEKFKGEEVKRDSTESTEPGLFDAELTEESMNPANSTEPAEWYWDEEKLEARKRFEQLGGIIDPGAASALLAEGTIYGNCLYLEMMTDNLNGGRFYRITEYHDGEKHGEFSPNNLFRPSELRKGRKKLEDLIYNLIDDYAPNINNILEEIELIETHRLLVVTPSTGKLNSGVVNADEVWCRLENFILDNPCDDRLMFVKIKNNNEVGIVGRGKYTAYQNFRRIIEEIAPENDAKKVKDAFRDLGNFITDNNNECLDCQRTIPKAQRGDMRGDKMFSLLLGPDIIDVVEKARGGANKSAKED